MPGNYGIPLNHFAFGEAGEDRAIIFFVGTVFVSNTLGVFLASRGAVSTRRALLNVARVPLPYAAAIGLVLNLTDVELPRARGARGVHPGRRGDPGDAGHPGHSTVARVSQEPAQADHVGVGDAAGRFALDRACAGGLLGLSGLTRQVAIIQAAMPTAVISGVLASEFGGDVDFVTGAILVSTHRQRGDAQRDPHVVGVAGQVARAPTEIRLTEQSPRSG